MMKWIERRNRKGIRLYEECNMYSGTGKENTFSFAFYYPSTVLKLQILPPNFQTIHFVKIFDRK